MCRYAARRPSQNITPAANRENAFSGGFIPINPPGTAEAAEGRNENRPYIFYMTYNYLQ